MATIFRDVLLAKLAARPAFVADVAANLLLTTLAAGGGNRPIKYVEMNRVPPPPRVIVINPPNLLCAELKSKDTFFWAGPPAYDWTNPVKSKRVCVVADPPNLLDTTLRGQDKFFWAGPPDYDWPNTRQIAREISSGDPPNLLVTTLVPPVSGAPFYQTDWPTPRPKTAEQTDIPPNLLVDTLATPFYQTDWMTPRAKAAKQTDVPPNSLCSGLAGQDFFFGAGPPDYDWPNPRTTRRVVLSDPPNLLETVLARPFFQIDWPTPRAKPAEQTDNPPNLLSTTLKPIAGSPFFQTNWPTPKPRTAARVADALNLTIRMPVVPTGPPVIPIDWPPPIKSSTRFVVAGPPNLLVFMPATAVGPPIFVYGVLLDAIEVAGIQLDSPAISAAFLADVTIVIPESALMPVLDVPEIDVKLFKRMPRTVNVPIHTATDVSALVIKARFAPNREADAQIETTLTYSGIVADDFGSLWPTFALAISAADMVTIEDEWICDIVRVDTGAIIAKLNLEVGDVAGPKSP